MVFGLQFLKKKSNYNNFLSETRAVIKSTSADTGLPELRQAFCFLQNF